MRKKIVTIILTLASIIAFMFGLTACNKVVFEIKFMVDNEIYATINTTGKGAVKIPENPTKEDYTFEGWFWDNGVFEKPFTANSLLDVPLTSDMSVYAKFTKNHVHEYNPTIHDPTCTEQGYTTYSCVCGDEYNENFVDALGHSYIFSYLWNNQQCIAVATCETNSAHIFTEIVDGIYIKDTDATCTTAETGHYVAEFTNAEFVTQFTATNSVVNGVELGHVYTNYEYNNDAKCEINGTETAVCDHGCGESDTRTKEGTALEHLFTNYEYNNDAKCEINGTETAVCDHDCGESDTRTKEGTALEHLFTNYEYNNDAKCEIDGTETAVCDHGCGESDTRIKEGTSLEHSYAAQIVYPTCNEQGYTIYVCDCGEWYNSDFVNALGHRYTFSYVWNNQQCIAVATCETNSLHNLLEIVDGIYVKDTDATCTTAETGHYVAEFTNAEFVTQFTATNSVVNGVELGHVYTNYEYNNDAKCEIDGTETAVCDHGCGESDTRIKIDTKLTHDYDVPTYVWENDVCAATRVCLNDSTHVEIETIIGVYVKDANATCTTAENGHYLATFVNSAFGTQTTANGSVTVGQSLGHNYEGITYVWDDENHTCTATRVCLTDSTHVETETVTGVYAKDADANCTTAEIGHYVATFTNKAFKTQNAERFNTGEPLGHSFTNYISNNDATFDTDGTATATCDRNDCEATDTIVVEDSKLGSQIKVRFKVNGVDFDINNDIMLGNEISIVAFVGEQLVTENITYKVIRLDSNPANNYELTITNDTFKAVLTGAYKVTVYYIKNKIEFISNIIELNVIANTNENARVINTFSDSTSVAAAYLASNKEGMVEGTAWYSEYNGRYGVISTVGQTYNTSYSAFYLRSADYNLLSQLENAGFLKTIYNVKDANGDYVNPDPEGYLVGFNSENWDYLSIKAYFAKPEGAGDTLNVYYADNTTKGDIITVNYNEWVELRLDKGIILKSLCNAGRLLQQYSTANDDAHRKPMFYTDSANVGTVYFDSMSFEKYAEYKHFAEFYYEDAGVQVPKDAVYTFAYSTSPRTLAIKIKLEEGDSDYLTIPTVKSGANIGETTANIVVHYYDYTSGLTRTLQDATGAKVSYSSSHQFYADKSKYNVPAALQVSATAASRSSTVCLKYIYTHTDGTKYVGYLAFKGTATA